VKFISIPTYLKFAKDCPQEMLEEYFGKFGSWAETQRRKSPVTFVRWIQDGNGRFFDALFNLFYFHVRETRPYFVIKAATKMQWL